MNKRINNLKAGQKLVAIIKTEKDLDSKRKNISFYQICENINTAKSIAKDKEDGSTGKKYKASNFVVEIVSEKFVVLRTCKKEIFLYSKDKEDGLLIKTTEDLASMDDVIIEFLLENKDIFNESTLNAIVDGFFIFSNKAEHVLFFGRELEITRLHQDVTFYAKEGPTMFSVKNKAGSIFNYTPRTKYSHPVRKSGTAAHTHEEDAQ